MSMLKLYSCLIALCMSTCILATENPTKSSSSVAYLGEVSENFNPFAINKALNVGSFGPQTVSNYAGRSISLTTETEKPWIVASDVNGGPDQDGADVIAFFAGEQSQNLWTKDYGFDIPCNATIESVTVNFVRRAETNTEIVDIGVSLFMPNLVPSAANLANPAQPWMISTTAWETVSYTDANWGELLTPDVINDDNFGVLYAVQNNDGFAQGDVQLDAVEIEVCYSVDTPFDMPISYTTSKSDACEGEGEITIDAIGGSGTYEYSLDEGLTWQTSNTFTGLNAGDYKILVRNTDGTCATRVIFCALGADERILQPGDALVTCKASGPDFTTLTIENIQPLHDMYQAGSLGIDVSGSLPNHPFEWSTGDLGGDVFSVTHDEDYNIFTGVTSLYNLVGNATPIVSRIDGVSGNVTQFPPLPGTSGVAGVEYVIGCDQLFVANLDDGKIYRMNAQDGTVLTVYDPLGADDGVDGLAPQGELVLAVTYNYADGRLYYSMWNGDGNLTGVKNSVRSVELDPATCNFVPGTDRLEIMTPWTNEYGQPSEVTSFNMPVTDIEFSQDGQTMLLAESGYDSSFPKAQAHDARFLRYTGATNSWSLSTALPAGNSFMQYEIGQVDEGLNSRGGIDFAAAGMANNCTVNNEQFIIGTGDALRGTTCFSYGCIYGFQYLPINGGNPLNSVLLDVARNTSSQQKSVYGDMDVIHGCRVAEFCGEYDLALTKVITSTGPFMPGSTVDFTITVTNEGTVDAANVVVTENSATGLIFGSMTPHANVTDNGNETFTIASLPQGTNQTISVSYTIDANFMGTSIRNNAQITEDDGSDIDSDPDTGYDIDEDGDGDPDDDDEDGVSILLVQVYDLTLSKSIVSTGPYSQGSTVDFRITVENEGSLNAANVVVMDDSPADLTFVSMTPDANVTDNGNETFTIASLPANGTQDIFVSYQIANGFQGTTLRNNAQIIVDDGDDTDSDPDSDYTVDEDFDLDPDDDDEDGVDVPIGQTYDLSLTKTLDSAGPFSPGSTVVFTINVVNEGTVDASNIEVTDDSPAGLVFVSSNVVAGTTDNGNETFTIASIPAGTSVDIEVTYMISNTFMGTSLRNDAQITADDGLDVDSDPDEDYGTDEDGDGNPDDDDEDGADVPIGQVYDLELTKAVTSAGPYSPGSTVEYTITVDNVGSLDASGIEVTDAPPAGLTYVGMQADANITDNGGGVFTIASVPAGQSQDIVISYTIDANFMGTSLTNDAQITADDGDDIDSDPDTDNTVDEDGDGNPDDDDEDDATITIGQVYDLELTKAVTSAGPYSPGSTVEFTITVENAGTLSASGIEVTDAPPAGLTYVGMQADANVTDNGGGVFTVASLPAGQTQDIIISYTIDANFMGTSLTNDAQITADDGDDIDSDPDTDNTVDEDGDGNPDDDDEDDATITIGQVYDLELTKAVTSSGPYSAGSTVEYTITVANAGSLNAAGIEVTDAAPAGLTYVGMQADANVTDNGGGVFTVASLPMGVSQDIVLTYTIDANFMGTSLTNDAQITADDGDDIDSNPDTDNTVDEDGDGNPDDDDEDDATISIGQVYDLELAKIITSSGPYSPGSSVEFTITVSNVGTIDANGIEVTDNPPAGITYVGMQADANITDNGGSVFTITSIPAGTSQDIVVTYMIDNNFMGSSLRNTAEITADDGDDVDSTPNNDDGDQSEDDEDGADFQIGQIYDLSLTKTLTSSGPFQAGSTLTFDIEVSNDGSIDANNIEVTDRPSAGLTFVSMTPNGNVTDNGGNVFTITFLGAGLTETIEVTYQIDNNFMGASLRNDAEITADDGDDVDSTPDNDVPGEDDQDGLDIPVLQVYDLALAKTLVTPEPYALGQQLDFEITVTNEGDLDASNIEVTDTPQAGLSYVGMMPNANVTDNGGGIFTIGNIPAGASETIQITHEIDPLFMGNSLNNIAQITGDDGDDIDSAPDNDDGDQSEDDEDKVEFQITIYDLALVIDLISQGPFFQGDDVIYTITVFNQGNADATNVEVVDYIPAGFILSPNDNNGWTGPIGGSSDIYTNTIANIPAGGQETVDIVLNIDNIPNSMSVTNWAEISVDDGDDIDSAPDTTNNDPFGGDNVIDNSNGDEDDHDSAELLVEVGLASLGDRVFNDENGNGRQDPGEPGVENIIVKLYNDAGFLQDLVATDANGNYLFDDLLPGNYYIEFDIPAGLDPTIPFLGNDTESDSNVDSSNGPGTTPTITLTPGENDLSVDLGIYACVPIGDYVWFDRNMNNTYDRTTENGINGLQIDLYRNVDGTWVFWDRDWTGIHPDRTSDDGYYKFCAPPGEYYLDFNVPPTGMVPVTPGVGSEDNDSDLDDGNGQYTTSTLNIMAGQDHCNIGAGFYPMGSIGDIVWLDNNANGVRTSDEPAMGGVLVEAYNIYNDMVGSSVTDQDGQYMIDYLRNQDYYLKFYPPAGYTITTPNAQLDDSNDSDVDHSNGENTTGFYDIEPGVHTPSVSAGLVVGVALPVNLVSFSGSYREDYVSLKWLTESEINTDFFIVERRFHTEAEFINIARQPAKGVASNYSLNDYDVVEGGVYYYRLRMIDKDGSEEYSEVISVDIESARTGDISIYPNPAIDRINLDINLKSSKNVTVDLYNATGQLIKANLINQRFAKGVYNAMIDVSSLEAGVYNVMIKKDSDIISKKIIVMKN